MRKNRTKHEAKKPRLAKRALALCFALIFVCSCLLPVFAHSEAGALAGPQETVVEEQQEEQSTNDPTGNDTNPTGNDANPTGSNTDSTEQQGNEQTKPEGTTEESKGTTEETKTEGTTEESKDSTEEPKTEEPKTEEPKQPTTNTTGDTINQGEATYTYRFWPKEIDAFDLEAINDAVKKGESLNEVAQSKAGVVPCTILTVKKNAYLGDFKANVQQPTKDGYEFAGWYTIENGTNYDFFFDQNVNDIEESKTIDVFAKWEKVKAEVKQVELGGKNVSVEVENAPALTVSQLSDTAAEELGKKVLDKINWDEFNVIYAFDLEPKDSDGLAINSAKKVTISGLNIDSSEDVKVFHLGANFEEVPAEVSADGTLTFTPSSFSPFAIALADDSVASYPEQDDDRAYFGEDYIMLADEAAYDYTVQEGGTVSVTGVAADWYYHEWSSSHTNVATVSGNSRTVTVKGVGAGVATLTHKYWDYSYSDWEYKPKTEKKTVRVTPKTYANQNADIFFLKTPTGSAGSNDISEWLPQTSEGGSLTGWTINEINMDGVINVTGAKWDSQHKNIVLSGQDKPRTEFIKEWPDGTKDGVWKLYRSCPKSYTGTNSSLNEATFAYVLENIWAAYKSQLETDLGVTNLNQDLISEITLTPYKISQNQTMHIDCTISVTGLACTAKFHVEAAGDVGYQQVFGKDYSSNQQVTKPSVTELTNYKKKYPHSVEINSEGIPKTRNVHGVNYTFAGWYPEDGTTGKPNLDASEVSFAYPLTTEDMKRGEVNFYARYVADDQGKLDQNPYIAVEKKIVGLPSDKVDELVENFTVKVGDFVLKAQAGDHNYERGEPTLTPDGLETTLRWKIDQAEAKPYYVKESGYDVLGYNATPGGADDTTVNVENATFTAKAKRITEQNINDFKVGESGEQYWVFVASLTSSKNVVISNRTLSAKERASIVKAVKELNGAISNQSTLDFYSIAENQEIELTDKKNTFKIRYSDYNSEVHGPGIHIEHTSNWNMVATVNYSMEDAKSADIKLTNTYKPATTSLTVTKTATKDGVEDTTTEFNFTLTLGSKSENVTWSKNGSTDTDTVTGTSHEFTLKGGESITFSGISVEDTNVKVTEDDYSAQHYTTTIKVNGEAVNNAAISADTLKQHQEAGTTVNFTNAYTTPKLPSMTIQKKVTGAFGERTKEFAFSVTLNHTNPALLNDVEFTGVTSTDSKESFKLKHGQSVELKNIPIDTIITITEEDANDYKTSATGHSKSISSGERTFTYTVMEEGGKAVLKSSGTDSKGFDGNTITVTNDFDGNPDTGVLLDTLPYLILLAVAVAGGVLVVVRKRKHRDE